MVTWDPNHVKKPPSGSVQEWGAPSNLHLIAVHFTRSPRAPASFLAKADAMCRAAEEKAESCWGTQRNLGDLRLWKIMLYVSLLIFVYSLMDSDERASLQKKNDDETKQYER